MASEFGEKLIVALEESRGNINNFIWKGPKVKDSKGEFTQTQIRLVDASDEQLLQFYKHCTTMLFNKDKRFLGRVHVLAEIEEQRNRCGVELFYRDADTKQTTRFAVVDSVRTAISNAISKGQLTQADSNSLTIGEILNVGANFSNLPASLVIEGGLDKLGRFDRSHITLAFILKQGLWFTKEENLKFNDKFKPDFKKEDKLRVIKKELKLPEDSKLYFNPLGLNYSELKSILSLRTKKYRELNLEQLTTLRYKMLFALEDEVNMHISQWNDKIEQIKMVAETRKLTL